MDIYNERWDGQRVTPQASHWKTKHNFKWCDQYGNGFALQIKGSRQRAFFGDYKSMKTAHVKIDEDNNEKYLKINVPLLVQNIENDQIDLDLSFEVVVQIILTIHSVPVKRKSME